MSADYGRVICTNFSWKIDLSLANIGTDLLTLSLGKVYLGHINWGGVHAVDQLTEHHTVSERQLRFLAAKIWRNFAKMRKFIFPLQIYPRTFEYFIVVANGEKKHIPYSHSTSKLKIISWQIWSASGVKNKNWPAWEAALSPAVSPANRNNHIWITAKSRTEIELII
jgi:hypothetical protein